jgi:hypothetical protein
MRIEVKSKRSGDRYLLTPESLLDVNLLEDLSKVFERYKDKELAELINKLLND